MDLSETQLVIAELVDNMRINDHYFGANHLTRERHSDIEDRMKPSNHALELAS